MSLHLKSECQIQMMMSCFCFVSANAKNHVIKKYKLDDLKSIFGDIDKTKNMDDNCKSFVDRLEKFNEEMIKLQPPFEQVKNIWDLRGTYDIDTLFEEATNMNYVETSDFMRTLEESCIGKEKQEKIKEIKSRSEVILSLEEGSDELPG